MLSQLKRFLGDSFLYAFMSMSTKLIAFIMFPIYTKMLGKVEYGVFGVLEATISILTFLIIFGTDSALAYYYFEEKDDSKKLAYVQNVMGIRLAISCLIGFVFFLGGSQIASMLNIPDYVHAMNLMIITLIIDSMVVLVLTVYRYEMQTIRVVISTILKMLLIAVISYLLLLYVDRSVNSVILGRLLSAGVILLALIISSRRTFAFLRVRFDKEILKKVIYYAAPLVPVSLAFWVIGSSNRYLILILEPNEISALGHVAIYDAAFRFASMISLLTYGIQMAWRPYSMKIKDQENGKELFAKVYIGILVLGLVGILLVTQLMPWVIQILDPAFYESFQYVGFLSLATFVNFYYLIISSGLLIKKKTKTISVAFGIAAVLSILLNIILFPLFSVWGIAVSNLLTYLVATSIVFYKSQQVYYIPVATWKLIFLFIQAVISMSGLVYLQTHASYSGIYQLLPWLYFLISLLICRIDLDLRKEGNKI